MRMLAVAALALAAAALAACGATDDNRAGANTAFVDEADYGAAAETEESVCTADEATRIDAYLRKATAAGEAAAGAFEEGQALQASLSESCHGFWQRVVGAALAPGSRPLPGFGGQMVFYDPAADAYHAGPLSCTPEGCA